MIIWIDADSCPVRIREIICKASMRVCCRAIFVANRQIPFPKTQNASMIITSTQEQAADRYICENASTDDIVITRDISLAKQLVDNGICVINDRGTIFTSDNINSFLSARNFMYELQANGLAPEKIHTFGKKEIQKFSNVFDAIIVKLLKNKI